MTRVLPLHSISHNPGTPFSMFSCHICISPFLPSVVLSSPLLFVPASLTLPFPPLL